MKRIIKHATVAICMICTIVPSEMRAQELTLFDGGETFFSERPKYVDEGGLVYYDQITVNFGVQVLPGGRGVSKIDNTHFTSHRLTHISRAFTNLEVNYGRYEIEKVFPDDEWGPNSTFHRQTGLPVPQIDQSQLIRIRFASLVPVDKVIEFIRSIPDVIGVSPPAEGYLAYEPGSDNPLSFEQSISLAQPMMASPNDWGYVSGLQWSLSIVDAEVAWDYGTGTGIKMALTDTPSFLVNSPHSDLAGRFSSNSGKYGGHMERVASRMGAKTNNASWLASVGWGVASIRGFLPIPESHIQTAVNEGARVINFSWVNPFLSDDLEMYLTNALNAGVVLVAGAGNEDGCNPSPPCVLYPAAFTLQSGGELLQVIAVSATTSSDNFKSGYNYSPGTDPISEPTNAFIDVGAPGENVWVLDNQGADNAITTSGTSHAAPMVAAAVAVLLDIDPTLSVTEVYDLITHNAEKTGTDPYDPNGWNQYLGYGRLNIGNSALELAGCTPPTAPSSLTITNAGQQGQYPNLSWNASSGTVDKYEIYRAEVIASTPYVKIGETTSLSYTDYTITISNPSEYDDKYSYKVRAVADCGTSGFSNVVTTWGEIAWKNGDELPLEYSLEINYPNPFNPETLISFSLPNDEHVSLVVRDISGKTVASLLDNNLGAGKHTVRFDGRNMASGMYFYTFSTPNYTYTRAMSLIK